MIEDEIAAFIVGDVMTIAASRDDAMQPSIARLVGTRRLAGTGLLDGFVSSRQWPRFCDNLAISGPLAITFVRPADYLTYQVKARITESGPASAEDVGFARGYIARMSRALQALGVTPHQCAAWFCDGDVVRIRYSPFAVFLQTPGPAAGTALTRGGA